MTRAEVGQRAGIEVEMLARYERLLVPLRCGDAMRIFGAFNLNPRWLALGQVPMLTTAPLLFSGAVSINENARFSIEWDEKLGRELSFEAIGVLNVPDAQREFPFHFVPNAAARAFYERLVHKMVSVAVEILPEKDLNRVMNAVLVSLSETGPFSDISPSPKMEALLAEIELERAKWRERTGELDCECSEMVNKGVPPNSSLPPLWDRLRTRLASVAARRRGSQADLARHLGVSRSAVSQWLSGENTPTAEATLHLLEWVRAEEAKQGGPRALERPRTHGPNDQNQSNETSIRPAKGKP